MLDLRPNRELCDRDLPPDGAEARICSCECTCCARCVEEVLTDVCPSCGGGFAPRPTRPGRNWRAGKSLGLAHRPASGIRVRTPFTMDDIRAHVDRIRHLPRATGSTKPPRAAQALTGGRLPHRLPRRARLRASFS